MNTFIILLRAVNVSGKNIIKMAELKAQFEHYDFHNVKTYIQSGNILLQSSFTAENVKLKVQDCISKHFGLDINVFVLDEEQLNDIIHKNPFSNQQEGNNIYITLLDKHPNIEEVDKLASMDLGKEEYMLDGEIFYFYVPEGMANSKLSNPFIESKLKVSATGRNLNTIVKLKEIAQQMN